MEEEYGTSDGGKSTLDLRVQLESSKQRIQEALCVPRSPELKGRDASGAQIVVKVHRWHSAELHTVYTYTYGREKAMSD